MAGRCTVLARHILVPEACAAEVPLQEASPDFAGFKSPTGRSYAKGTSTSLMGNLEPVKEEISGPLQLIHGALPKDLDGQFIRTGPNPFLNMEGRPYHEFEGDGMLHASDLRDGIGTYKNRWVRTERLKQDQEKGKPGRMHEYMTDDGMIKGQANTHVVYHAKQLLALYEVDKPYVISVPCLETLGLDAYKGNINHNMTAHPKVCPVTGELIYFGYDVWNPVVHYGVVDKEGKTTCSWDVPTQGGKPVMMHDMAITEKYSILLEFPLYFEQDRAIKGEMPYVHDRDRPSMFAIFPRNCSGPDEIRWFQGKTAMTFHIANAWEEGNLVKLIGCPTPCFDFQYGSKEPSRLYEWTFDLASGSTSERELDSSYVEFPVINPKMVGKQNRYVFTTRFTQNAYPFLCIRGCMKFDLSTGQSVCHDFLDGRFGGECVFAPRPGSIEEDDGYLLTYTYNPADSTTELYVMDAKTFDSNPVAILKTPGRVPFGFHGMWLPRDEM
eukprot:gnl/MRDRNA2_/MRDRNA2_36370_c0_seq1.p1 gnl/MRDRNA2_/MRDRNA2_36370_c0~~gnl/MRDRNA2_/MRDRNA2_36370_c0_seq1.p1  ORF type:complete len:496 (-),score=80.98 gnl/MRDRNA2_/MRDRNA2_36370_c0_seq1:112-1599(-)